MLRRSGFVGFCVQAAHDCLWCEVGKWFKLAIVHQIVVLGGTCLNVGCIPSKTLLNISHKYHDAKHNFSDLGIETSEVKFDLGKMMTKKTKVVDSLTKGIEMLFKKNKVDYLKGVGKFQDANTMVVEQLDGSTFA